MKSQKGFSLIELLVVMAIISILATVGTIQYMKYIANSRYAKLESTARQMMLVAEDYYSEFNKYFSITCGSLSSSQEQQCSVGNYNFKVPPFTRVEFIPTGSNSKEIRIILESGILKDSSRTGPARLVIDSTTSTSDIACVDDEIHGKKPENCP